MLIPTQTEHRLHWLNETRTRLRRSMDLRRGRYATWRAWYLHGNAEWGARYNKIGPQLNTLAGYLYAPRSVRFGLDAGSVANAAQEALYEPAADRLRALWVQSGADEAYSPQTLWSLVYGSTIVKFGWKDQRPQASAVSPGDFGVWRDDLPGLEGQQAMMHVFRLDSDTVRAWLRGAGMGALDTERWIARWGEGHRASVASQGSIEVGALNPIGWQGGASTPGAGAVTNWGRTAADYDSPDDQQLLEVEEVWAMDDATGDWRIVQIVEGELILSDRANDFLQCATPFVQLSVDRLEDYFWGYSLVAQLIPLQAWREKRMNQLDRLFSRQANPPMLISGLGGVTDEKAAAVMRRGGVIGRTQTPGAKVDLLTPSVNEMSFNEIGEIDQMFTETLGLAESLQGGSPGGSRGGSHQREVMSAAAGRLTRRMMNVERSVAKGAALLLGLARRYDDTMLETDEGQKFVLAMLSSDANVEVTAHSASPVFAGQAEAQATQMLDMQIIDKAGYLDLADPPMAQSLKRSLKAREKKEQAQVEKMVQETPQAERGSLFAALLGKRGKH